MFSLHTNHTRTQQPHTHKLAEVNCSNGESGGKVVIFEVEVQTKLYSPWGKRQECEMYIMSKSEVFVHVRCKQLWSNESSLNSTRFYKTSGQKDCWWWQQGQVWLTWASLTKKDTELSKQLQLDFSAPASQNRLTQTELNAVIGRYVVENMLPLSTVDSDSFRALISKIPGRAVPVLLYATGLWNTHWKKKKNLNY